MKKTMIAGAIIASLSLATAVEAKEGNYFGFGLTQHSLDAGFFDADVTTLDGKVGTYFNENFSGELRLGLGVQDDTVFGSDIEIENYYGAYLRAGIPVTDGFYPYAIVGYTNTKVGVSGGGSDSESDMSYGLGADFAISDSVDFTAEFMRYLDKDGVEVDGIGLGFKFKF
ncbi:MAG TPA: porin family protein [Kangiella sp.]|uniref:porin family protein n=1 Tax=Kangiella sp. TaxID=1920245 RepID=UPI002F9348B2